MPASTECTVTPTGTTTTTILDTTQVVVPSQVVTTRPATFSLLTSIDCILSEIIGCISSHATVLTINLPETVETITVPVTHQVVHTRLEAAILFGTTCSTLPTEPNAPTQTPTSSEQLDDQSGGISMTEVVSTPPPITQATTITLPDGAITTSFSVTQPPPTTMWIPVVQTDTSNSESSANFLPLIGGAIGAVLGFVLLFATFWYLRRRRYLTTASFEEPPSKNRFSLDTDERRLSKSIADVTTGPDTPPQPPIQLPPTPAQPTFQRPVSHHLLHHEEQQHDGQVADYTSAPLYPPSEAHTTQTTITRGSSHSHYFRSHPSTSELSHGAPLSPTSTNFYLPPSLDYAHSSSHDTHDHDTPESIPSRSGSPTSFRDFPPEKRWTLRVTNATPTPRESDAISFGREESFGPEEDSGHVKHGHGSPFGDSPLGTPTAKNHERNPFDDKYAVVGDHERWTNSDVERHGNSPLEHGVKSN